MAIGDNCDTKFYFDGKFIREASSHRCLSPVSYVNDAEVYFTTSCNHVVLFQYDVEESDMSFSNAPTYSIHSLRGHVDPGTPMIVHSGMKKYTIGHKGKKVCQNKISTAGTRPGPRLNIKTVLSTYGDFHVKDKTAVTW